MFIVQSCINVIVRVIYAPCLHVECNTITKSFKASFVILFWRWYFFCFLICFGRLAPSSENSLVLFERFGPYFQILLSGPRSFRLYRAIRSVSLGRFNLCSKILELLSSGLLLFSISLDSFIISLSL